MNLYFLTSFGLRANSLLPGNLVKVKRISCSSLTPLLGRAETDAWIGVKLNNSLIEIDRKETTISPISAGTLVR